MLQYSTILQKIKEYDNTLCVCVCVCVYIYTVYEILLYTEVYLSRFKTNSMFHTYDTRNTIYSFQVITPNYLNTVPHTTVCFL
jgi:hypothetical protein